MAKRFSIKKGDVIIADPFLQGPVFERSVILISDYSKEGAMGFIINQPTKLSLSDAIDDVDADDFKIFYGGPVDENMLFYIHSLGDIIPQSVPINKNMYWGGDFNIIKDLINQGKLKPNQIKFFVGYAGWESGQLKDEFKENTWIKVEYLPQYIFSKDPKTLWNRILRKSGSEFALLANFPHSPSLN